MLDNVEYSIDGYWYQGNGHHRNGYHNLDGDWLAYYKVGKNFTHKVKPEDREDFLHELFLAFARVKASYQAKGKELTTGGLVRIAQYEVADYWRKHFRRIYGRDCSRCSKAQRQECKDGNLYSQCPKAIRIESLDTIVEDGNGDSTPLCELIADDNAIDLTSRLDAKLTLDSYPQRFVQLAYKKYAGYPLTNSERQYYRREQKKAQKTLV
jgi:DNA-directed RNA polymerase specialized sigma24 family protein